MSDYPKQYRIKETLNDKSHSALTKHTLFIPHSIFLSDKKKGEEEEAKKKKKKTKFLLGKLFDFVIKNEIQRNKSEIS